MARAAELLLSGRTFSGAEAAEWGIANAAMPAVDVLPAAMEMAHDIATNAAPVPVALSKSLLWEGLGFELAEWRAREGRLLNRATRHPDSREGTVAFLEKRDPRWTGRVSEEVPRTETAIRPVWQPPG